MYCWNRLLVSGVALAIFCISLILTQWHNINPAPVHEHEDLEEIEVESADPVKPIEPVEQVEQVELSETVEPVEIEKEVQIRASQKIESVPARPTVRPAEAQIGVKKQMRHQQGDPLGNHQDTYPPKWLRNRPSVKATGVLRQAKDRESENHESHVWSMVRKQDAEAQIGAEKYFWRQRGGIVFEMGALDGGKDTSISYQFLGLGWHRLLAEASPSHWKKAHKISKDATYVGAAICRSGSVHYLQQPSNPTTNGIAEFMDASFLFRFFKHEAAFLAEQGVVKNQSVDWSRVNWSTLEKKFQRSLSVMLVPCVRLSEVFSTLHLDRINLFILDVEGAEIAVLQSIDFALVNIDVICVETMFGPRRQHQRPPGFAEAVKTLLVAKGYIFDFHFKRNSWFHRKDFQPQAIPYKHALQAIKGKGGKPGTRAFKRWMGLRDFYKREQEIRKFNNVSYGSLDASRFRQ